MSKYSLKEIEAVSGKQTFYELEKDGKSLFREFCDTIEDGNNKAEKKEMAQAFAIMNMASNLLRLSKNQWREITPKKAKAKEYEVKLKIYEFTFST